MFAAVPLRSVPGRDVTFTKLAGRHVVRRLASGRSNIFWPLDPAVRGRQKCREAKRPTSKAEDAGMARSEALASVCAPLWEVRAGHRSELLVWFSQVESDLLESPLVDRIVPRLNEFAGRRHALSVGGGVTLSWPLGE
ncbi:hypothetical protein [Streptomyces sp. NPDC005799]|uniref:hypothetical protein n=1 Tax=Streptomyces sp. NPDC005799 TaxID=3154678 RepID=UPI0033D06565